MVQETEEGESRPCLEFYFGFHRKEGERQARSAELA